MPSNEIEQKMTVMEQDITISKNMGKIEHKIAVMSGKGGTGKSTVAVNLAAAFSRKGYKTGILDADIHGPNVLKMFGIEETDLKATEKGIMSIKTSNDIEIMSIGLLLPSEDSPIIWRGPKKPEL